MGPTPAFVQAERQRAAAWKMTSRTLPAEARSPAPYVRKDGVPRGPAYDFCLPADLSGLSLLPEVRDETLRLFVALGIPWHAGVSGGPSNHLLSSHSHDSPLVRRVAQLSSARLIDMLVWKYVTDS